MWEDFPGNPSTLVGDSNDYVLRSFADKHLDRRNARGGLIFLSHGLNRVSQELSDYIFEMAEDIGERRFQVTLNTDIWDLTAWLQSLT
jgi:hypothetical protein